MKIASEIAKGLIDVEAVKINTKNPFIWTSGMRSPVYCDNRITLSNPVLRTLIANAFVSLIQREFSDVNCIAGIATAGIAQGAIVADKMQLPYCYVRPEPKKHGMKNQIEGKVPFGARLVLVEDLISTGLSSLKAVKVCQDEGFEVLGVVSIFTYGLLISQIAFKKAQIDYYSLTNFNALNAIALENNYLMPDDAKIIEQWQKSPEAWSDNFIEGVK